MFDRLWKLRLEIVSSLQLKVSEQKLDSGCGRRDSTPGEGHLDGLQPLPDLESLTLHSVGPSLSESP